MLGVKTFLNQFNDIEDKNNKDLMNQYAEEIGKFEKELQNKRDEVDKLVNSRDEKVEKLKKLAEMDDGLEDIVKKHNAEVEKLEEMQKEYEKVFGAFSKARAESMLANNELEILKKLYTDAIKVVNRKTGATVKSTDRTLAGIVEENGTALQTLTPPTSGKRTNQLKQIHIL